MHLVKDFAILLTMGFNYKTKLIETVDNLCMFLTISNIVLHSDDLYAIPSNIQGKKWFNPKKTV